MLLCLTPNVVLLVRHGCGCQNRQADVLERDYQQKEKLETIRPEIRRSRVSSTEQSVEEEVPDFALQLSDQSRPSDTSRTIRDYHKRLLDSRPNGEKTLCELMSALNCQHAYEYLAGTRSKPWDERELDSLEGFKFISFLLTTLSQTAFSLVATQVIDLFSFMKVVRMLLITAVISANVAMETFVYLSVFLTTHRCFQIMDARGGSFQL